jgi:hypothetical protein
MPFQKKCLWAEFITASSVDRLRQDMVTTGANFLCLRTETPYMEQLLTEMHGENIKVYGWMWPHARPANNNPNDPAYAPNEMNKIIGLVGKGLDGYIFDIETNANGAPGDWGKKGPTNRATIAAQMVAGIANAFNKRGTPYVLGLTSHQWAFSNYPDVPFTPFLDYCNALFPQTYWRADGGSNGVKACNPVSYDYSQPHPVPVGTVDQALFNGFTDYANKKDRNGMVLPIIPIGGEIGCTKAGEMTRFGQLVAQRSLNEIHFYVDIDKPGWVSNQQDDPSVLNEIKAL